MEEKETYTKVADAHSLDVLSISADKGDQGLEKVHKRSLIPIKNTKPHKISYEEKVYNKLIHKSLY